MIDQYTIDALNGALADRYSVEREIGQGGMATVYLATDVRHHRKVALKVLHPELSAVIGSERFLKEIEVTANLQHPHILPLFDSGEAGEQLFYVMPFVEGETLRSRLDRERQLPIDEAVAIAREVADALEYAHGRGVVHRDIKPENILLQRGHALVADFGIALAVQHAGGQRMTQTGLSLGTPQYMSPEQAMGEKQLDPRSDIYSLAAVTYEMLAGEPPFGGATVQAIVAKVIAAEPERITTTRRNVSAAMAAAVHRGLEKVPADRFQSAAAYSAALVGRDAAATSAASANGVAPAAIAAPARSMFTSRAVLGSIAAAAAAVALAAAFAIGRMTTRTATATDEPIMATLAPAPNERWGTNGQDFSVSPNGRRIAVISGDSLVVRSLDSLGSQAVRNTRGATLPFWSPDGRSIGFFADNQLKTVDVATGAVRGLCPAARPTGGTWGSDGTILFVPDQSTGLYRTGVSGGTCENLKIALPEAALDGRPYFFPDAKHFVFTTDLAAYLGELGRDSVSLLVNLPRARAVFAAPAYLLYTPDGSPNLTIFAQRIDVRSRKLIGEPVKVLDDVPHGGGNTSLSAATAGTLVARVRTAIGSAFLSSISRGGELRDTLRAFRPLTFGPYRLSHDGRRLVFGGFQFDVLDLERRLTTTLIAGTPDRSLFQFGQWSPKDTAIAYMRRDSVGGRIVLINVATSAARTLTSNFPPARSPKLEDWSADGRHLAYSLPPGTEAALSEAWIYDISTGTSQRLFNFEGAETVLRIAPNGRSIANVSAGVVYVRSFPAGGTPVRVSPESGRNPRWRADGRELYYLDGKSAIVAVQMRDDGTPASVPQVVVPASVFLGARMNLSNLDFEPSPDGKEFHVTYSLQRETATLTVLTNWWKHAGVSPQ